MKETLKRYPSKILETMNVRPMEAGDGAALTKFFRNIPVDERQLFKEDVTDPSVVEGWAKNLNHQNILPMLVFDGPRIVADATLHRNRQGWSRHVAKIRVTLDPSYRRRGLARSLIREFLAISEPLRIAILLAEILDVQKGARDLFEDLGFTCVATLPQNAIDLAGRVHDVLVYSYTVVPPERLAPEAALGEDEADVGGAG